MTNYWQDKYKDLKVGESALYWHKPYGEKEYTSVVLVSCKKSMQDGCKVFLDDKAYGITEAYPNGPRCMTPEEIEKLLSSKDKVELPNAEVYQDLEDEIVEFRMLLTQNNKEDACKKSSVIEELFNIYKNEPLFPGDSISHMTLKECLSKKWAVRSSDGFIHTTKSGREYYHSLCLKRIREIGTCEFMYAEGYQELEDSVVECKTPTPMPEWLEKQLDIVLDTVSQWSEEKKKDFLGLTEENRKEIFEFAMKRSDEILRGKKDSIVESKTPTPIPHCRKYNKTVDQGYCPACKSLVIVD